MAVGVVAAAYHGASPSSPARPLLRKMDYYTICYCSNVLRRAAHIGLPAPLRVAALLAAPVKPTAVTGLNLLLVEVSSWGAGTVHGTNVIMQQAEFST
jgi:hypothetical protein